MRHKAHPGPDLELECALLRSNRAIKTLCGVDEAGRGPLCGPVVAAAVVLDLDNLPVGLNDSKQLSAKKREQLFEQIYVTSQVGVGEASVAEIDALNILHASMLAMVRAVTALQGRLVVDHALIDGNRVPATLPVPGQAVVKGDAKSLSIAAASIIAKVTRDRIMAELDRDYPHYGWAKSQGYPTQAHLQALALHGVTPHHRRSFKPVKQLLPH
ncbi:RNase HII [Magnetococcus marinus MC-1]|uniref:Ribonuclease HII n=1 Tax=Magnetococcus marinus (strain ATCC BAA-1437 / JCM 17883 / MC-1) TaxID=156889 RepID=RNH2_MAGMM|nr:ribonuclease HII [Magnetococcus marinus]A0L4Z0.1 RecName: Full=Ribonuclease HII; Short=RNase HII [Magnetococcus marinus MC-1]ABK43033.1 RNase HII [Magnetococcus marinus MC-1]